MRVCGKGVVCSFKGFWSRAFFKAKKREINKSGNHKYKDTNLRTSKGVGDENQLMRACESVHFNQVIWSGTGEIEK